MVQEPIQFVVNMGMKDLVVGSDYLDVIMACRKEKQIGEIRILVSEILSSKAFFP